MNGYLQRLAASAIKPARSLHPTVGSRWAAASSGVVEEASETLVPMAPRTGLIGVSSGGTARTSNLEQPMVETSHAARPEAGPVDEPARGGMEARGEGVEAQRVRTDGRPAFPTEAARVSSSAEEGEEAAAAPTEAPAAPPRVFVPLLPEVRGTAMQARTLMPAGGQPVRARPMGQAPPEGDAIEIHIGRIEVTAARPQSSLPPAARPAARKSLDLGEYLKRDRRSR